MKKYSNKILVTLVMFLSNLVYAGVSSVPNVITNTSQVNYSLISNSGNSPTLSTVSLLSSVNTIPISNVPVNIQLGQVTPNGNELLSQGVCYGSGGIKNLNSPSFVSQSSFNTPSQVNFNTVSSVKSGDPLFIQVTDFNAIKNPNKIETINAIVTETLGDSENIILTETAPSSGVFIGYVQTTRSKVVLGDCQLEVTSNDTITVNYSSSNSQVAKVSATVLVDPLGKVFDTTTGSLVNGATISLYNSDTNTLAQVLGDDGKSIYPSKVISGASVTDSGGNVYNYGTGEFRFPLIKPGNYKIVVTPPSGYSFPTALTDAALLSKFPKYNIVSNASRGFPFVVMNSTFYLDVPLDSRAGKLVVSKNASTNIAAIGDFIQYNLTVQNTDTNSVNNVKFNDLLPKGFKLKTESFYIDNKKMIPMYDGKTISYNLGVINSNQTVAIKYVVQISNNTSLGNVTNTATANGDGLTGNIATAMVVVNDDLMTDKAIVVGNVYETTDCNRETLKPLENIKIQFETGDYVVSDKDGRWHLDNLSTVTHVAKIDKISIPKDYEPVLCENNTKFADNPSSRFVESRPGSIERVDFYLKKKSLLEKRANAKELSLDDLLATSNVKLETKNDQTGEKSFKDNKVGVEALSLNDKFMANASTEDKWLFPEVTFNPPVPAVGVAFQTKGSNKIKLFINGKEVNKFNYDGARFSADKSAAIHYWRGVPLSDGKNLLVVETYSESDEKIGTYSKELYFTSTIVEAHFLPAVSKLKADGTSPIEVAIRFIDDFGHPAHKGLSGTFELNGPYNLYLDRTDGLPVDMLNLTNQNKNQYVVGEDGVAIIKLMPTSNAGEMTLRFNLKDKQAIIRPWITSAKRDWILVGIADGSATASKILNHTVADDKGMEIVENNENRIALYGKGTIKGDYLLTLSYDNKKQVATNNQGTTTNLTSQELYSVYGDATLAQKDALSSGKLYIRIEKEKFYAMFGNYQTNLTITDLTRYDRNLNGFKSEYKGEKFNYNVFAAKTATLLQKDEIQSDGTSGPYRTKSSIVIGSETVTLLVRDRNQRDNILSSKILNRYVDYNIDYDLGLITLNQTPPLYDLYLDPYFIHVEYNTLDVNGDHVLYGGRVAYNVIKNTEVGVTVVNENGSVFKNDMRGVDVQYDDGKLRLKLEGATSSDTEVGVNTKGAAYNVDAQYQNSLGNIHVYDKKVDPNFGLSSSLPVDTGIEKHGGELTLKLDNQMQVKGDFVDQKDLRVGSEQKTAELKVEKKFNDNFTGYVGTKYQENINPNSTQTSINNAPTATVFQTPNTINANTKNTNILVGGEYDFKDIPLKITSQLSQTSNPNIANPETLILSSEYAINNNYSVLFDKQFNNYGSEQITNINRIGLKSKPWSGGQIQAYVGDDQGTSPNSFYQFGINQNEKYQLWSIDIGYAKQGWSRPIQISQTPAGTLITQDNFNLYTIGVVYRNEPFVYQLKVEDKKGSLEDKVHVANSVYKKLDGNLSVSLGQDYLKVDTLGTSVASNTTETIKGGVSYRGKDNTLFGQLSWINQNQMGQTGAKYVLNAHDEYKPNYQWEYYTHLGYKYVVSTFDTGEYKGASYVVGGGVRRYLGNDWDVSVQGLLAGTPSVGTRSSGASFSVGYKIAKNAWASVGYEFINNYDYNYSFYDDYLRGFFVRFRFKFDEETFHLNNSQEVK